MNGAVSICHYSFENARISKFSTWNETPSFQVLCACTIPLPSSLSLWRNKAIMATPEQKAFCVLQSVKHESVVSVQRAFQRQFNSEGQSVCATTTREHNWFEEKNYRSSGDHQTWLAHESVAGIGLSPRCVPCDKGCIHRTFVGMYHKLVELLFHFY